MPCHAITRAAQGRETTGSAAADAESAVNAIRAMDTDHDGHVSFQVR